MGVSQAQAYLASELVAALGALELPDPLVPSHVHAQLLHGCRRKGSLGLGRRRRWADGPRGEENGGEERRGGPGALLLLSGGQTLQSHPEVTTAGDAWEPPLTPLQSKSFTPGDRTRFAGRNLRCQEVCESRCCSPRGALPALASGQRPSRPLLGGWPGDREGDGLPQARAPLKVFPQIWQKWGRPSWWRLATCLSRGPFSVKRCSQNSQLKGLSPVWVRLCLSRLAVGTGRGLSRGASATGQGGDGQPHLGCGRSCHRGGTGRASRPCACAGAC